MQDTNRAFLRREIEKIINLLVQELVYVLKNLKYRLERITIPGIGEFSRKDVLIAILQELREIKWELELIKNRLREVEKTLEERKAQKIGEELKTSLILENSNDNEESVSFLSGEG